MKHLFSSAVLALSLTASSLHAEMVDEILDQQILPDMQTLAESSAHLATAAEQMCRPGASPLREAYAQAFDAWIRVSHLRFGPSEVENRAFALAFWPDSRGKTPKTLAAHLRKADPTLLTDAKFAQSSIAGRGFYALEFFYFSPEDIGAEPSEFTCGLTRAIARDIASNSEAIYQDWLSGYARQMREAQGRYANESEVKQELYKALNTGLQVLSDMRLGRPLGTFDHPRPKRAEAWRSGRSQRHILLSLEALKPLAISLATGNPGLAQKLATEFDAVLTRARALEDPQLAGVADPQKRIRIEALQQEVNDLRSLIEGELGPALGVLAGFNALDGD